MVSGQRSMAAPPPPPSRRRTTPGRPGGRRIVALAMARSVRIEFRTTPQVSDAIDQARGLAAVSTWCEAAAIEKLERDGVQVVAPGPPLQRGSPEHYPATRPAPR